MNVCRRVFKEQSGIPDALGKEVIKLLLKLHFYIGGANLEKHKAASTILLCYIHPKEINSITKSTL